MSTTIINTIIYLLFVVASRVCTTTTSNALIQFVYSVLVLHPHHIQMSEFKTISSNDSNSSSYPVMTKEIVLEILESPAPYKNDEERNVCQRMVEALVPDEQDAAACTSYAYWFAKTFFSDQEKPSGDIQLRMAMREARRHLVGSANDEKAALERFRLACQSRLVRPSIRYYYLLLYLLLFHDE